MARYTRLQYHDRLRSVYGGPEFKKEWEEYARQHIPEIRTARPYKKNEQAYIEKLNRTLRDECVGHWKYSPDDLLYVQEKVDEFVDYYHNKRPHLALNFATSSQFILMLHLTCNTTGNTVLNQGTPPLTLFLDISAEYGGYNDIQDLFEFFFSEEELPSKEQWGKIEEMSSVFENLLAKGLTINQIQDLFTADDFLFNIIAEFDTLQDMFPSYQFQKDILELTQEYLGQFSPEDLINETDEITGDTRTDDVNSGFTLYEDEKSFLGVETHPNPDAFEHFIGAEFEDIAHILFPSLGERDMQQNQSGNTFLEKAADIFEDVFGTPQYISENNLSDVV